MGTLTSISWTDHTFNPWIGCTKVGPACDGCYAEALFGDIGRFPRVQWGKPGQRATHARTAASTWAEPRRWDRMAARDGVRRFVFCASVADVFDNDVPAEWRRDLFDLIQATPNLTWLLLTKRPQNIERLYHQAVFETPVGAAGYAWPRNAAIGCTVVSQTEANRDVPHLLVAKESLAPAFAFLSMEPLLGAVDLTRLSTLRFRGAEVLNALTGVLKGMFGDYRPTRLPAIDWVITGGETDQGDHMARPTHPDWFRSLRDQCAAAGVAYQHKQNGEWKPICWMADGEADDLYHPAPRRHPEATRRCKVPHTVMNRDGSLHPSAADPETYHAHHGSMMIFKVGVGPAGRQIDGRTHDARPERAA